jgi:hypothetical protein
MDPRPTRGFVDNLLHLAQVLDVARQHGFEAAQSTLGADQED